MFLNRRGEALTCSGFTYILKKHVHMARAYTPGLSDKRVSPHVLRHTCAMNSLQATRREHPQGRALAWPHQPPIN